MEEFLKVAKRVWQKIKNDEDMNGAEEEMMQDFIFDWIECFEEIS